VGVVVAAGWALIEAGRIAAALLKSATGLTAFFAAA
jgi:hypothetical protein